MPSNSSAIKLNRENSEKSYPTEFEGRVDTFQIDTSRLKSKDLDILPQQEKSLAAENQNQDDFIPPTSPTLPAADEDDQYDIIAQNNLLIEAGAVVPKANWIPVTSTRNTAIGPTLRNPSSAKKTSVGKNAIQIQWTQNEAKTKRNEHHCELETKLVQAGGQVSKQLERQRLVTQAFAPQPQPNPGLANVKPNSINVQSSSGAKIILNTDSIPQSTFKPKVCIRAGFDSAKQSDLLPRDYKKDATIGDSYKFLLYPEADSSSILFHSLQGDLMRKRQQISGSASVKLSEIPINEHVFVNLAKNESLMPKSAEESSTPVKATAIEFSQIPPAPTLRMDSNSVTDLSQFYYHAPEPSFLEKVSDKIYGIFQPPQPYFWKVLFL